MTPPAPPVFAIGSFRWPGFSKLVEEMGETSQVIGKLMGNGGIAGHWDGTDLREHLQEELADLLAAVSFVIEANAHSLDVAAIEGRAERKRALFRQWHVEQRCTDEKP